MENYRIEKDALGKVKVPRDALYGSFTVRARKNFNLSGQKTHPLLIKSLGLIKTAASSANQELKLLDQRLSQTIQKAAHEYSQGEFYDQCMLDPFQAGAGTPYNMNANEVIANRANQLLGEKKGTYKPIHPNNHVNMGQSSNDVIPTATRIAALFATQPLLSELEKLIQSLNQQTKKYTRQIKAGRTHLQDAVPMTVAQEIGAWRDMLKKDHENILTAQNHLRELGIGGTAIGSGINSHPRFKQTIIKHLNTLTKLHLKPTQNTFETTQSMTPLVNFSASLRSLAIDLIKISNDLKLLNSGPKTGIGEYMLPDVEPGSSIMPGKVNPSIVEAVEMVGYQIMGNEHVIALAAKAGQLQLNVTTPIIIFNLLWSIDLLTNTMSMFRIFAINDLRVNVKRCQELFEQSHTMATALSPHLGYHQTALVINEALKKNTTVKKIVLEKKLMSEKKLRQIFSPLALTKSHIEK